MVSGVWIGRYRRSVALVAGLQIVSNAQIAVEALRANDTLRHGVKQCAAWFTLMSAVSETAVAQKGLEFSEASLNFFDR